LAKRHSEVRESITFRRLVVLVTALTLDTSFVLWCYLSKN